MAAAVSLDRNIVAHRHGSRESSLLCSDLAGAKQLLHNVGGCRAQRHVGELGARHLEDDRVAADGLARRQIALETGETIAHHVRRQLHEGRGLDDAHAAIKEEVDVALLEQVVEWRVDQVDRKRLLPERRLDLVETSRHLCERQTTRAERAEHAALACRDHEVCRGNALSHRARIHREINAVVRHERRRAEAERRNGHGLHRNRANAELLNQHAQVRVEQRSAHRSRIAGFDRVFIGTRLRIECMLRRWHRNLPNGGFNADPQHGCMVDAQLVDIQVAIGDDSHAASALHDALDVHLDISPLCIWRHLAAVLPGRLSEIVREGRIFNIRREAGLDAPELEGLVHRLDAEGAGHHRVAPEVAAEEPVALVHNLEAVAIPLAVLTAACGEADAIEEAHLVRPADERVVRRKS